MWSSLPPEVRAAMLYILSQILGSERLSYFSMAGFKSLGYLIVLGCRENAEKLFIAKGWLTERMLTDDVEVIWSTIILVVLGAS
jgi:hypothetical protein